MVSELPHRVKESGGLLTPVPHKKQKEPLERGPFFGEDTRSCEDLSGLFFFFGLFGLTIFVVGHVLWRLLGRRGCGLEGLLCAIDLFLRGHGHLGPDVRIGWFVIRIIEVAAHKVAIFNFDGLGFNRLARFVTCWTARMESTARWRIDW